jgi:hypothetical protein
VRALAMRPCPPSQAYNNHAFCLRPLFALSLRHICRLEGNDLVNNEMDYSGLDAFGASLATNGRLRVLGCAAVLWGSALTFCVPSVHGYLTSTPLFTCVTSTPTFPSSLVCSSTLAPSR